jgi:predicted MFS family arabinose efflux permease
MWGLGAALYFIGFYQRVAPAVITAELSDAFQLTAAALGHLSAFYFYSYVAMQIPSGILVDRYGPRVLLTIGGLVAAIGTAVFAIAPNLFWANAGRLLIGGSVGVAFVAMLKLASHWMPPQKFALASGVALAVGVFGAVFAGAPLRMLVNEFGWRNVMWASAALKRFSSLASSSH